MAELIFWISSTQVENERDFFITRVFSWARRLSFTIKNLYMLTFTNKHLQLHEHLNNEDVKYEYFDMME